MNHAYEKIKNNNYNRTSNIVNKVRINKNLIQLNNTNNKKKNVSYNNENKNNTKKIDVLNKSFPKEVLQDILNELLNKRLTKLESSTKSQMSDLNKISKNSKDFSKSIQQISNNTLEKNHPRKIIIIY